MLCGCCVLPRSRKSEVERFEREDKLAAAARAADAADEQEEKTLWVDGVSF